MRLFILLLTGLLSLISCTEKDREMVSNPLDYNKYLTLQPVKTTSKYFMLWNSKIKADSLQLTSFGNVAGEYERYFQATGEISYLKKAEQALEKAVEIAAIGKAGYHRALARNYISQHRFREALYLAEKARKYGSGVKESQNLLFDVYMELGQYHTAEKYLDSIQDFKDFGYLIRIAKWNDHLGHLPTTINFMEQATKKAEDSKSQSLMLWAYTNLADFYGHAGRIAESYKLYLKALAIDPTNAYAKKGIAWIVFSHEKNPREALRILDSVTQTYKAPDYFLLKAEIADFMDDERARLNNLDEYFNRVRNPAYGDMYNAYNIEFYLEETFQHGRALEMALKEVENRPTPASYAFLAYSYFKMGDQARAEAIAAEHIIGKSFEPGILLKVAEICKASGNSERTKALKSELMGALYELGPASENRVRSL